MQKDGYREIFESQEMQAWFDSLFLDPFTTDLDERTFRIDLYDSERAFIVEALIQSAERKNIRFSVSGNKLQIKVTEFGDNGHRAQIKTRTLAFPIDISCLRMEATYHNEGILEIHILKEI